MKKRTLKEQTQLFSVGFLALAVIAAIGISIISAHQSFRQQASSQLEEIASTKMLQFQSGVNSEIALVLQMTKVPSVISYMTNPDDQALQDLSFAEFESFRRSFLGQTVFWVSANDKRFYSDGKFMYTVNPENPDDYWYNMTILNTQVYNFNINYNKELKKTMLWINAVIRNNANKVIGLAGTGIPLTGFIEQMFSNLPENTEMYLFNSKMEVTGAANQGLVESKVPITQIITDIQLQNAQTDKVSHLQSKKSEYVLCPLSTINWTLLLKQTYSSTRVITSTNLYLPILLILITILVVVSFNVFIAKILSSIQSIIITTNTEAAAQTNCITGISEKVMQNVEQIETFGVKMKNQLTDIELTISQTSELLEKLSNLELLRQQAAENAGALQKSSEQGSDKIQSSVSEIADLENATHRLEAANVLISGITSRTNLLAINATIEAAHAGEHGASFAVVAKEISSLAEKSRIQQQEVSNAITDMKLKVLSIMASSETAGKSFSVIVENTDHVQASFTEMSGNIEKQNDLGEIISSSLQKLTNESRHITDDFHKMKDTNSQIVTSIEQAVKKSSELMAAAERILLSTGMR